MQKNSIPRIRAMQAFFKHEPPSVLVDDTFDADIKRLDSMIAQYELYKPQQDLDTLLAGGYRQQDLLAKLTYIADNDKNPQAGRACYILGCIYFRRNSPYDECLVEQSGSRAAYFFGQALRKGYVTRESQTAYAEAAAFLGWHDTALRWMPKDAPQAPIAKIYLSHLIRLHQENGSAFPKADADGIVPIAPASSARSLKNALMPGGQWEKRAAFCQDMDALEQAIPRQTLDLTSQLDGEAAKCLTRKKRGARKWLLLVVLVLLLALPGCLLGNGEGIQRWFYGFLVTITPSESAPALENLTLAEKWASRLDMDDRSSLYGSLIGISVVAAPVLYLLHRIFVTKRYYRPYLTLKEKLSREFKLQQTLRACPAYHCRDMQDTSDVQRSGARSLNELAKKYHAALAPDITPAPIPPVELHCDHFPDVHYGHLPNDYDAFTNAMRILYLNDFKGLLWSGRDLGYCYHRVHSTDSELYFYTYFSCMFAQAADEAEARGNPGCAAYCRAEEKRLDDSDRRKQENDERRIREAELRYEQSGGYKLTEKTQDPEDKERSFNLWMNGSYATNQELLWDLRQRGKISDDEYAKNMFNNGRIRVENEDDGT